ncbi:flagellar basal-body MS-ring/collar protein FliF [Acidibrevibacterium fodinaquatile]|uniref:flagellar basal-body MS-ring/collar protein FliF n=1 Tax=Acidibrevibacterium fodinaquatile TaxID=1969806 RepID=UPI001F07E26A|nr:flagellar basal-body MS-ring/collar protein FliF [Acidibrevibacterium fodinaquatile]
MDALALGGFGAPGGFRRYGQRRGSVMQPLLDGLKTLGPLRLAAMAAVAVGTLGLLALLAFRGTEQRMALLYSDLDMRESAQIVEQLDHAHIAHQSGHDGAEILVPTDQVAKARLLLAKDGLPSGGSVGYEIFDRSDTLTANQFQLAIDQTRALEGELARTIRAIHGVRAARVHLVLPRREPFSRDPEEAQASVLLTMAGASRMDRDEVQAILNLVAAAVPSLKPQNISIVDSRGNLLARAGNPVGDGAAAMTADEIRRATELRLSRAVEEMLEQSLGFGHVRAEASVQMNFDQLHQTEEKYDPDGQVVRSQQSVTDNSKSTDGASNVSVQNNLPNPDNGTSNTTNQEGRQEDTTNYEISKSVRTLVHDAPQIQRISVAVMVDGAMMPDKNGKLEWQERSPEEIARISALVKSAVGFDEKRGDQVQVVSMRFTQGDIATPTATGPFGLALEHADIVHLVETLLFGIVGVLALLVVLRPMVLRLTTIAAPSALAGPIDGREDVAAGSLLAGADGIALPGAAQVAMLEDERMTTLANIEGQLRLSSIRKIADLVDKHPEESVAIMRGWMAEEQS